MGRRPASIADRRGKADVSDFAGMLEWMRETLAESVKRERVACPVCNWVLEDVDGVKHCPRDGWTGR